MLGFGNAVWHVLGGLLVCRRQGHMSVCLNGGGGLCTHWGH